MARDRRRWVRWLSLLLQPWRYPGRRRAALLAFALVATACARPDSGDAIRFNLGWLPQGSVSGVIIAKEKGFYSEAGLDVSLSRGFGGIRTANEVDQGLFQFGYADPVAVLMNRAAGGGARLIGAINHRWPGGLCFVAGKQMLKRPGDLAGKTVGGAHGAPMQVLLPLLLRRNGVDPRKVNILQLDPSVVDAALIEGVLDAAECWLGSNKAILDRRGADAGKAIGWLPYSQFGIDMYGSGIVASDGYLSAHPETARKFLMATFRGYRWAIENPQAAAEIVARRYPVVDRAIIEQQIKETADLMVAPGPAGAFQPDRMQRTFDVLAEAYAVERSIQPGDLFTNRYLPETSGS